MKLKTKIFALISVVACLFSMIEIFVLELPWNPYGKITFLFWMVYILLFVVNYLFIEQETE